MYHVVGLRKRNGKYVREELYLERGELWENIREYIDVTATWDDPLEAGVIEEMLEAYKGILEKLRIQKVAVKEGEFGRTKDTLKVKNVEGEVFNDLVSKIALGEIMLEFRDKDTTATLKSKPSPRIYLHTKKDEEVRLNIPLIFRDPEDYQLCIHVKDGSLIIHKAERYSDAKYKHGITLHREKIFVDLKDVEEKVEFPWPEQGITINSYEAGLLYKALIKKYQDWLFDTERYKEVSKLNKEIKKLNLIDKEEMLRAAEAALDRMKRCKECREKLGDRLERIRVAMGRYSPVFLYTPTEEEAKRIFTEENAEWADLHLKQVAKSLAEENRDVAAGNTKEPVLAPVHLEIHWNAVSIYIGHDAHGVYTVTEAIKHHLEEVLRSLGIYYRVEYC